MLGWALTFLIVALIAWSTRFRRCRRHGRQHREGSFCRVLDSVRDRTDHGPSRTCRLIKDDTSSKKNSRSALTTVLDPASSPGTTLT